jgi:RNA polymerase sigma factor (sigma-70 family)
MSAVLALATVWAAEEVQDAWRAGDRPVAAAFELPEEKAAASDPVINSDPAISLAFYRKHTERILRRYLYASMQVGRAPSILSDPVGRGWASSRRVRTFEDAVIFVLDVEKCLDRLGALERAILSRVVLQEYTQAEAAVLLGMSVRTMSNRLPRALDQLTEQLLDHGVLVLPE